VVDGYLDLLREQPAPQRPSRSLWLGPGAGEQRRIARLLLGLGPADTVLDAGCGDGAFVRDFARIAGGRGCVVGVDVAADALAAAAASAEGAAFIRADVRRLPFSTGAFDAVCCFGLLHLVDEPWPVLDELTRMLGPGGRLALMTTCRTRTAPARMWDAFLGDRAGVRMFEPDEVTDALATRGYDPVRRRVAGLMQFVGGRRRRS